MQQQFSINNWPKEIETIGSAAIEAMLLEVACAPSPGLVDRFNSGAHKDMDIFTFLKSSSALAPAMYQCAIAGWQHSDSPRELLPHLRSIGAKAEKAMFAVTKGANTQKGLLFLMGIVVAATAIIARGKRAQLSADAILHITSCICENIVQRELGVLDEPARSCKLTAGERLYLSYGVTGIRGEIENGLPSVKNIGLPNLYEALHKGLNLNDALIHTLIAIMAETTDTTILNRHNLSVLKSVQLDAIHVLERGGMYTESGRKCITKLDRLYIDRNISPGGTADLLAVTYFLYTIEQRIWVKHSIQI